MSLKNKILELKKDKELSRTISQRLREFEQNSNLFSELCFCILTANASAQSGIRCQNALDKKFLALNEKQLAIELRKLKYRFPNKRANYISAAQSKSHILKSIVNMPSNEARQFLVKNFKGIGMKEASHFLRNIGRKDVAIIDRHILRALIKDGLISEPKSISKEYPHIENKIMTLANQTGTNLAELDLLLWYNQTGKILK